MSERRWIKTSLFLILVLQFTAATGYLFLPVNVRVGDEVTLPCHNVTDDHKNCDSTEWIFYDSIRPAVVLVRDGQIVEEANFKSDRLSVSEKCSLVIKNVTDEDGGRYICRQRRSGTSAVVYLSVVTMTEHEDNDEVTLNCSVSIYGGCDDTVKWLIQGPDIRNMTRSQSPCLASVSFSTSHFIPKKSDFFKCQVMNIYTGEVTLFSFSLPQSSGEDATTTTTGSISTAATEPEAATGQVLLYVTVRDGDEVTLPCNSVIDDHKNCDSTTWIFRDSSRSVVDLVQDGQIVEEANSKSDRLSVSEKCSLKIKNVTDEDAAHYKCRQFISGQQQGPDTRVYLSVVTMTEHEDDDEVTLNCSVSIYGGRCEHRVKWLLQGPDIRNMTRSQSPCSATVSFSTSHFIPKKSEFLDCQVMHPDTGEVTLFSFSLPQSSGE